MAPVRPLRRRGRTRRSGDPALARTLDDRRGSNLNRLLGRPVAAGERSRMGDGRRLGRARRGATRRPRTAGSTWYESSASPSWKLSLRRRGHLDWPRHGRSPYADCIASSCTAPRRTSPPGRVAHHAGCGQEAKARGVRDPRAAVGPGRRRLRGERGCACRANRQRGRVSVHRPRRRPARFVQAPTAGTTGEGTSGSTGAGAGTWRR